MLWSDLKFGVEMEYSGISRQESAAALSEHFGTEYIHVGGSYDTYACYDAQGRKWSVMSDSSIRSVDLYGHSASRSNQCELVSPVLTFEDMPLLMEALRRIRRVGGKSNSSCGFHVHLSAPEPFNVKQLINLIYSVHSKQDLLYEALQVTESRQRYCEKLPECLCTAIREKKPQTMDALADIYYDLLGSRYNDRTAHYNEARYYDLNLHNLFSNRLPTVELRCANGGFSDVRRVKAIIQFYALLVAYSYNAKKCSYKSTIVADGKSKKYTFRVFMLKLGCIGPDLAICRKYMLEHLSGDIAWSDR